MNLSKIIVVLLLMPCLFEIGWGQETPEKSAQQVEEKFRQSEPTILKAIGWLEQHPFTDDASKRKEVVGSVLRWLMDCPYIGVSVDTKYIREIVRDSAYEHNGLLVVAFLFGKAQYIIEHQNDSNERQSNISGLEGIIRTYHSIKSDRPSDPICEHAETLRQMMEEGKLAEFVIAREKEQ